MTVQKWLLVLPVPTVLVAALALLLRPDVVMLDRAKQVQCKLADDVAAVQRFSGILQFQTISDMHSETHVADPTQLIKLHSYLADSFPLVYSKLEVEKASSWLDPCHSQLHAVFLSGTIQPVFAERKEPMFAERKGGVEQVNLSLLLKWPGKHKALNPIIYISHTDVVPVGEVSAWKYGPFSGAVAEG